MILLLGLDIDLIHKFWKISKIFPEMLCSRRKTEFNSKNLKSPGLSNHLCDLTKSFSFSGPWCLSSITYCTQLSLRPLPLLNVYAYQYFSTIQVILFILEIIGNKVAFCNGKV